MEEYSISALMSPCIDEPKRMLITKHSNVQRQNSCHLDIDIDEETVPDRLNIHGGPSNASEHAPREPP